MAFVDIGERLCYNVGEQMVINEAVLPCTGRYYNKCVLNNRLKAVIVPEQSSGSANSLLYSEFAHHISLCQAHFALMGKTKCKKNSYYKRFFLRFGNSKMAIISCI